MCFLSFRSMWAKQQGTRTTSLLRVPYLSIHHVVLCVSVTGCPVLVLTFNIYISTQLGLNIWKHWHLMYKVVFAANPAMEPHHEINPGWKEYCRNIKDRSVLSFVTHCLTSACFLPLQNHAFQRSSRVGVLKVDACPKRWCVMVVMTVKMVGTSPPPVDV